MYALPAFLTPLPFISFTTENITGCTNEAAKGANKAPRSPPSSFFISSFTVLVTPQINTPESSNDFIILIISLINLINHKKYNDTLDEIRVNAC